jgi:hypothetical protein
VAIFPPSAAVGEMASMTGELSSSSTSLSETKPPPVVAKALKPFVMDVELKEIVFIFCQIDENLSEKK